MKLHFDQESGALRFASVAHYLLEKSRVTLQMAGEQAFHAFYLLCAGAPSEMRTRLHLGDGATAHERFGFLQEPSAALAATFQASFDETTDALRTLASGTGAADAEVEAMVEGHWRTCAAILHLGEIRFDALETRSADPASVVSDSCAPAVAFAADLLGCTGSDLVWALTHRKIRGVPSPRTPREASVTRDTLAKAVYERNFDAIVKRVNTALVDDGKRAAAPHKELFIGLLDIFGSEIFPTNGFEQVRHLLHLPSTTLHDPPCPFADLPRPSLTFAGLRWPSLTFADLR